MAKLAWCLCLASAALAAPGLAAPRLILESLESLDQQEPTAKPEYSFRYRVADDQEATYMSRQEQRDGDQLTGEYSYVDAFGDLVNVRYTAGAMGYAEERSVTTGFVEDFDARRRSSPSANRAEVVEASPAADSSSRFSSTRFSSTRSQASTGASASSASSGLSQEELVRLIVGKIAPLITQSVDQSLAATRGSSTGSSSGSRFTGFGGGSSSNRGSTTTSSSSSRFSNFSPVVLSLSDGRSEPAASSSLVAQFGQHGTNSFRSETPYFRFGYGRE